MKLEQKFLGYLEGHNKQVTSIVTGVTEEDGKQNQVIISGGRDNKLLLWKLYDEPNEDSMAGEPYISLTGHNHFVSDLSLSPDCSFVLSSSWDKSMRLWSLKSGQCVRKFFGCQKELLSCTFSPDCR